MASEALAELGPTLGPENIPQLDFYRLCRSVHYEAGIAYSYAVKGTFNPDDRRAAIKALRRIKADLEVIGSVTYEA